MKIELRAVSIPKNGEELKSELLEKYPFLKDFNLQVKEISYPRKNGSNIDISIVYFETDSMEMTLLQLINKTGSVIVSESYEIVPKGFQIDNFDYSPIAEFEFEIYDGYIG